ncbi:MAG: endo-1,4-beta-xylanase [Planctomycetes bacterium]|nr:endo-1,4-beta-xylanase [Planctomycetota bacterium]
MGLSWRASAACLAAALLVPWIAASRAAAQEGQSPFVRQFLACGPYKDLEAGRRLVGPEELPFEGHATMGRLWVPIDADARGYVDLGALGPASSAAILTHVYLRSDADRDLVLLLGSDDRAQVTLNGRRVYASPAEKVGPWQPDQEKIKVRLVKGWNRLLICVWNDSAGHGFSARFTLPDGRPVTLESSAAVPHELLDSPWLKRPLAREEVDELLALLERQVREAMYGADRLLKNWRQEGVALDRSYASARDNAVSFVEAVRGVLETVLIPGPAEDAAARAQRGQEAMEKLRKEVLQGPYMLTARTDEFLQRAETGSQLWNLVAMAASTAQDAGQQAAEVNRALVAARQLLDDAKEQYLRPYRLRESTLRVRTAELTVHLERGDGSPIDGAQITAEQVTHDFPFGCNLFAFGLFPEARQNETYLRRFRELFNMAVVPMYWSLLEYRQGNVDYERDVRGRPGPEPMLRWCAAAGLRVKATPLLANDGQPLWLRQQEKAEEIERLVRRHVAEVVGHFKGRVDYWDVTSGAWPQVNFGKLRLGVEYPIGWAAEADGRAQMLLGTQHVWIASSVVRKKEADRIANLAGVALAAYQDGGAWSGQDLEVALDRMGRDSLPVHLDQVMIPGPPRDEDAQALAVEEFYRTAFAHPAVASISWHDLSDRFALGGKPGGLLREDLSPKPAYQTLVRLIRRTWHTLADGRCDGHDGFTFRGYYGRYRIRATLSEGAAPQNASWDVDLTRDGPQEFRLTWPPAP